METIPVRMKARLLKMARLMADFYVVFETIIYIVFEQFLYAELSS